MIIKVHYGDGFSCPLVCIHVASWWVKAAAAESSADALMQNLMALLLQKRFLKHWSDNLA